MMGLNMMVLLKRELNMTAQKTGAEGDGAKEATRWTTTLPLQVNFPEQIKFKAVCGIDLVT